MHSYFLTFCVTDSYSNQVRDPYFSLKILNNKQMLLSLPPAVAPAPVAGVYQSQSQSQWEQQVVGVRECNIRKDKWQSLH